MGYRCSFGINVVNCEQGGTATVTAVASVLREPADSSAVGIGLETGTTNSSGGKTHAKGATQALRYNANESDYFTLAQGLGIVDVLTPGADKVGENAFAEELAAQITTAITIEPNGSARHVPTEVYELEGRWFSKNNSMSNSVCALIRNNVSFATVPSGNLGARGLPNAGHRRTQARCPRKTGEQITQATRIRRRNNFYVAA